MSDLEELNNSQVYIDLQNALEMCSNDQFRVMRVPDLRGYRNKIQSAEVSISVARRVAQGWLDIILLEKQKLEDPGDSDAVAPELLPDLVSLLSVAPTTASNDDNPRLAASLLDASNCDSELLGVLLNILDKILVTKDMNVWLQGSSELFDETVGNIAAFEKILSKLRKRCHKSIDSLQDEIVGRIKSGEVKVDEIIK